MWCQDKNVMLYVCSPQQFAYFVDFVSRFSFFFMNLIKGFQYLGQKLSKITIKQLWPTLGRTFTWYIKVLKIVIWELFVK